MASIVEKPNLSLAKIWNSSFICSLEIRQPLGTWRCHGVHLGTHSVVLQILLLPSRLQPPPRGILLLVFPWRQRTQLSSRALAPGTGRVVRGCTNTALGHHANLLTFFGPVRQGRAPWNPAGARDGICGATSLTTQLLCHQCQTLPEQKTPFVTLIRGGGLQVTNSWLPTQRIHRRKPPRIVRYSLAVLLVLLFLWMIAPSPLSHPPHRPSIAQTWLLALAFDILALAFAGMSTSMCLH